MDPIPLQRVRVLLPFARFLENMGVAVQPALERARMPLDLEGHKDSYVPVRLQVQFLNEMLKCGEVDDLGLRVAQQVGAGFVSDALRAELRLAATLNQGLRILCAHIYRESAPTRIWMVNTPGHAGAIVNAVRVFHHGPVSVGTPAHRHMDWVRAMFIIAVVRLYAGQQWMPSRIRLAGDGEPGDTAQGLFPNTILTVGNGPGYVELPNALLALPLIGAPATDLAGDGTTWPLVPEGDFAGSLTQLMQTYLSAGYPSVELAAELAGVSKRSLQRCLRQQGTSYRELIGRARFDLACHLLHDPGLRVLDVAYALGYEDPSNFGRAFRQIAGMGPDEFRRTLRSTVLDGCKHTSD